MSGSSPAPHKHRQGPACVSMESPEHPPVITLPLRLRNRYFLFRHGHSLANQGGIIVSAAENGVPAMGGPLGTGWGLSDKGKEQILNVRREKSTVEG